MALPLERFAIRWNRKPLWTPLSDAFSAAKIGFHKCSKGLG